MMKRLVFVVFAAALSAGFVFSQALAPVNALDPVYSLLERAYAHGWIRYLPQVRPLTHAEVRELLESARSYLSGSLVPGRETYLAVIGNAEKLLDATSSSPLRTSWGEGDTAGLAYLHFLFSSASSTLLNDPFNTEWIGTMGISGGIGWGKSLFLGMENDLRSAYRANAADSLTDGILRPYPSGFEPDLPDYNMYTFFLPDEGRSSNLNAVHHAGISDLSLLGDTTTQAIVDFGFGNIGFNRQKASWGPGADANLALSQTAKPYDAVTLTLDIGKAGRFVWNTGFLQQGTAEVAGLQNFVQRMVTMHRIEYQFTPWFLFALYESIVYKPRFELSYLNPFSLYYVAEVRNGDTDNKLGGIDLVFRIPPLKAYLSFFADDWDTSAPLDFGFWHNIFGAQAGAVYYDLIPGLTLRGEYVYLSHWMYTHRSDFMNRYLQFGESLGYPLKPNSHRFLIDAVYSFRPESSLGLRMMLTQHGRGGYFEDGYTVGWDISDLYADAWNGKNGSYKYLDVGVPGAYLETTFQTRLSAGTRLPWQGMSVDAGYTFQYQDNAERVKGASRVSHFFDLGVSFGF